MDIKIYILLLLISSFICAPPPIPQPPYEVTIEKPILESTKHNSSNLKNLEEGDTTAQEAEQYVESSKVTVNILENGVLEEHTIKVTTKNLGEGSYYPSYSFSLSLPEGKSLELKSN